MVANGILIRYQPVGVSPGSRNHQFRNGTGRQVFKETEIKAPQMFLNLGLDAPLAHHQRGCCLGPTHQYAAMIPLRWNNLAQLFVDLQQASLEADDDFTMTFTHGEPSGLGDRVELVFKNWKFLKSDDAAHLLLNSLLPGEAMDIKLVNRISTRRYGSGTS